MIKVEFYGEDGSVEYDIEDGEIFTEEDHASLVEQGEWDSDDTDNEPNWFDYSKLSDIITNTQKPKAQSKSKSRKVRRKIASQSRKINRSK